MAMTLGYRWHLKLEQENNSFSWQSTNQFLRDVAFPNFHLKISDERIQVIQSLTCLLVSHAE